MGVDRLDRDRFGAALRRRRETLGLSMRQVAARAGMADSYVRGLEHGENVPTVEKLARLAAALQTTVDELLEGYGIRGRSSALADIECVYGRLDPDRRRVWLRIGHALADDPGIAAFSDPDLAERMHEEGQEGTS